MNEETIRFKDWLLESAKSKVVVRVALNYSINDLKFAAHYLTEFDLFTADDNGNIRQAHINMAWAAQPLGGNWLLDDTTLQTLSTSWQRKRIEAFLAQQQLVAVKVAPAFITPCKGEYWLVREELARLQGYLECSRLNIKAMHQLTALRAQLGKEMEEGLQKIRNFVGSVG